MVYEIIYDGESMLCAVQETKCCTSFFMRSTRASPVKGLYIC